MALPSREAIDLVQRLAPQVGVEAERGPRRSLQLNQLVPRVLHGHRVLQELPGAIALHHLDLGSVIDNKV